MSEVNQILKRAADKAGFKRVVYQEKNVPTNASNVSVFLFLGDLRSTFTLSSIFLKRFKEESRSSKYFILCSWPGQEGLFPWVDEYWAVKDEALLKSLYSKAKGFSNTSEFCLGFERVLNSFFEEVVDGNIVKECYDQGIKEEFFDKYKHIKRFLPNLPSAVVLGNDLNRRLTQQYRKVLIYPTIKIQDWKNGQIENLQISKMFWVGLMNKLLEERITPVVYQDYNTFDLSPDFHDSAVFVANKSALDLLALMRSVGCVLDVFSGISRYAIAARCPFVVCQDRHIFNTLKDYEIDDLCGYDVEKNYLYIFPAICEENNQLYWNQSLFDAIISKVISFCDGSNRDDWPSTGEINEIVPYNRVREIKCKRMGTRFIKIPKY